MFRAADVFFRQRSQIFCGQKKRLFFTYSREGFADEVASEVAFAIASEVWACAAEERGEAGVEEKFPEFAEMMELVEVSKNDVGSGEFCRVLVKMLDELAFVSSVDDEDAGFDGEVGEGFAQAGTILLVIDETGDVEINGGIRRDFEEFSGRAEEGNAEGFAVSGESLGGIGLVAIEFHHAGAAIAKEYLAGELLAEGGSCAGARSAEESDAAGGCWDGALGNGFAEE